MSKADRIRNARAILSSAEKEFSNYDENNLKPYKVVVRFDATNQADAEDFVYGMQPKDWLEHLEREEE